MRKDKYTATKGCGKCGERKTIHGDKSEKTIRSFIIYALLLRLSSVSLNIHFVFIQFTRVHWETSDFSSPPNVCLWSQGIGVGALPYTAAGESVAAPVAAVGGATLFYVQPDAFLSVVSESDTASGIRWLKGGGGPVIWLLMSKQ